MDRRRFVPSPEGLEGRALLSLFGHTTTSSTSTKATKTSFFGFGGSVNTVNNNIPDTFEAKELRIDHLPFYLEKIRPGRFLPGDTLIQLQTDLEAIATQLHWPGPATLNAFNHDMRVIGAHTSLSAADAAIMNHTLGDVLKAGGATPEQQANLQTDMNNLARVDANSPQPAFLATNDYSLVLQTILGVGRPIARPTVPELKANTGTRVDANHGVTGQHQPILVGTYPAVQNTLARTIVPTDTSIEIVDANNKVYGTAPVYNNGDYSVQFAAPLADGIHTFYVRAVDSKGNLSNFSPPFQLKIISRPHQAAAEVLTPPQGPLGLAH